MARKSSIKRKKNKRLPKKKGKSKDLKLRNWVVKRLKMKLKDLERRYTKAAEIRHKILKTCRMWNARKDIISLEKYKVYEETIKAFRNAVWTNGADLTILKNFYKNKLDKITSSCPIKISGNEWWNIAIILTQYQDLMDQALGLFYAANRQFQRLETNILSPAKCKTPLTIRYFINS